MRKTTPENETASRPEVDVLADATLLVAPDPLDTLAPPAPLERRAWHFMFDDGELLAYYDDNE